MKCKNKKIGNVFVATIVLMGTQTFASVSPVPSAKTFLAEQMSRAKENRTYVRELANKNGGMLVIDLSDKKQYEFIMERMRRNGKNIDNSPKFFEVMESEKLRKGNNKRKLSSLSAVGFDSGSNIVSNVSADSYELDMLSSHTLENKNDQQVELFHKSYSVMDREQDYVLVDTVAWTPDGHQIGFPGLKEYYRGEGVTEIISRASVTLDNFNDAMDKGGHEHFVVDSVMTINKGVNQALALSDFSESTSQTEIVYAATQYPRETIHRYGQTLGIESHRQKPVDHNHDGHIKICVDRDDGDCDYGYHTPGVDPHQDDLKIPFEGSVDLPFKVTKVFTDNEDPGSGTVHTRTGIWIADKDNQPLYMNDFSDYVKIENSTDGKRSTLTWNVPADKGNFGVVNQFESRQDVKWSMNIVFKYLRPGRNREVIGVFTEDNVDPTINPDFTDVHEPLNIAWGCLVEGTIVTLANGVEKPIETLQAGDQVKTSEGIQKVLAVTSGFENKPIYNIQTANDHSVTATENHPIPTSNREVLWASEVEIGDTVYTIDGESVVVKVEKDDYEGKVYNLKLGLPDDKKNPSGALSTFIAGGIAVGDLMAQQKYANKNDPINSPEKVLNQLKGSGWEHDYRHSRGLNTQ